MEYDRIYVEVWKLGNLSEIKRFSDALEAWKWIIEHNVETYSVSKGLCVVDNSG